jgi:predicted nucleotidyltransferase
MEVQEKVVKILLELTLICIFYNAGMILPMALFLAHAFNWIVNGQIWVLSRYVYTFNLFKRDKILKFLYKAEKIVDRNGTLDCLISGSMTEGREHNNSDLDIRIIASGEMNAFILSFLAVYLRLLALFYMVPLDIFVINSYEGLFRLKNEKKFLSILNKSLILADGRSIIPFKTVSFSQ